MKIIHFYAKKFIGAYHLLIKHDYGNYIYQKQIKELISRGLKIGENVTIEDSVMFDSGYPYLISIGNNSSIAARVRLLAHDDSIYKFTGGYARLGKIDIKDNCFIGQDCTILPGVTIGPNVMIAAGSLINKDIPPNSCVAGVPARFYAKLDEMLEKHKKEILQRRVFMYSDLRVGEIDKSLKKEVIEEVESGICYVKGKAGDAFKNITWNIS
jgi:maltose O-acetyltransferase